MNDKTNRFFDDLEASGVVDKFSKGLGVDPDLKITDKMSYYVEKYRADDGKSYYVKKVDNEKGLSSIASATMYGDIGIATPPMYMLKDKNKNSMKVIEQDVEGIDEFETILANNAVEFIELSKQTLGKYKWQIFDDEELIYNFLQVMTPSCFTQLQNMFLVDEIRTDVDRHAKNYFFYKTKESEKFEGVIAIDLELMIIYNYCGTKKDEFNSFLISPYQSALPNQLYDKTSYIRRIEDLRKLVQDGVLSQANLNALSKALGYDFPAELKRLCKKRKLGRRETNQIVTPIERLWEYNNNTIGKDLGL